jgi:hypothetical protein
MIIPTLLRDSPWRSDPAIDRLVRLLVDQNAPPGPPDNVLVWRQELERSAKAFEFDAVAWEAAIALANSRGLRRLMRDARPPAHTRQSGTRCHCQRTQSEDVMSRNRPPRAFLATQRRDT